MLGTIEAVERDLMRDGLLLRYRTQTGVDGLAGDEHPFLACSFWLVSAYAGAGRARRRHARSSTGSAAWPTTSACSPRSTTSAGRRMVGNFPQAFSHLTLVHAAFDLAEAATRPGSRSGGEQHQNELDRPARRPSGVLGGDRVRAGVADGHLLGARLLERADRGRGVAPDQAHLLGLAVRR